jgi:hypothetical protein
MSLSEPGTKKLSTLSVALLNHGPKPARECCKEKNFTNIATYWNLLFLSN